MAWYSYFLLNIPEALSMIVLTFVLLGVSIKNNRKSIIWFSFIYGGVAFIFNLYMTNALKPLIMFVIFSILVVLLFKMKIVNGFIIALFAFVLVILFELTFLTFYIKMVSLNYEVILENPWQRISASICTITLPMLTIAWILKKLKIQVKMPLLFK